MWGGNRGNDKRYRKEHMEGGREKREGVVVWWTGHEDHKEDEYAAGRTKVLVWTLTLTLMDFNA